MYSKNLLLLIQLSKCNCKNVLNILINLSSLSLIGINRLKEFFHESRHLHYFRLKQYIVIKVEKGEHATIIFKSSHSFPLKPCILQLVQRT